MLQFRQIQAFHTIMETGTVTAAARSLGISQPGVSNLVSSLEHQLGFSLFTRINGRLQPTAEALRLVKSTESVIKGFDQVKRQAAAIRSLDIGNLVIAGLPELSMAFLTAAIRQFLQQKPDINISFQTRSSTTIQELVSSHVVEIAVAEGPVEHDNLASLMFSYNCFCALPIQHRLASKELITPEDLQAEPLITLGPTHMTYHRLREIFSEKECVWNNRCQTRLFHTALEFVRGGLGVALVDPFTIEYQTLDDVVIRRFEPTVAFDLVIIWAADKPLSLLGAEFLERLSQLMADAKLRFDQLVLK